MLTALTLLLLQAAGSVAEGVVFTLPTGVKVSILEAPFKPTEWRVDGCSPEAKACRINGRLPFGAAFGMPRTYVKRITVEYQGRAHALDATDMYNAWGSRPLEVKGAVRYFGGKCFDAHNCQFRGLFSDAAGSFVAEWRIVNDQATRTVLTDSNDVVHLFIANIDPPEYQ
jgi:hypothetical protein